MANDAITMAGLFEKFGSTAQKSCWKLAKSHMVQAAEAAGDSPVNRAILFFGGADETNNHSRYYNNLKEMISSLKARGIKSENIIVMHADGLDPAPDQNITPNPEIPDLKNSEMDFLRKDGIAVIPATQDGLENVFGALRPVLKDNDHTLFYAFDHGGKDAQGETLIGWNREDIKDKDFAEIVKDIKGYKTYIFAECHSGGMAKDIDCSDGKTCALAATKPNEVSYEDGYADAIAKTITDSTLTTHELHDRVEKLDEYADETGLLPQWLFNVEHPQKYGHDFPVFAAVQSSDLQNSENAVFDVGATAGVGFVEPETNIPECSADDLDGIINLAALQEGDSTVENFFVEPETNVPECSDNDLDGVINMNALEKICDEGFASDFDDDPEDDFDDDFDC